MEGITKEDWKKSGKPLEEFLNIDDVIENDFVIYISNTFPNLTWNQRTLQLGKVSEKNGRPLYPTIEFQRSGFWTMRG